MWQLLGVAFCPIRLASEQDWGKLRYSQTSWEGGWANQQFNHLCVSPWAFQETMSAAGLVATPPSAPVCPPEGRSAGLTLFPTRRSFLCAEEPHRAPHANSHLKGWESGLSKWALYNQMFLSTFPTFKLILPTNITSPHFRLSFDTSPKLPHQQHWGPSGSGICIFFKASQTTIALYK